ncbi:hypothetical protein ACTXT7_017541, partial [Hymenolepis weldensis]
YQLLDLPWPETKLEDLTLQHYIIIVAASIAVRYLLDSPPPPPPPPQLELLDQQFLQQCKEHIRSKLDSRDRLKRPQKLYCPEGGRILDELVSKKADEMLKLNHI